MSSRNREAREEIIPARGAGESCTGGVRGRRRGGRWRAEPVGWRSGAIGEVEGGSKRVRWGGVGRTWRCPKGMDSGPQEGELWCGAVAAGDRRGDGAWDASVVVVVVKWRRRMRALRCLRHSCKTVSPVFLLCRPIPGQGVRVRSGYAFRYVNPVRPGTLSGKG